MPPSMPVPPQDAVNDRPIVSGNMSVIWSYSNVAPQWPVDPANSSFIVKHSGDGYSQVDFYGGFGQKVLPLSPFPFELAFSPLVFHSTKPHPNAEQKLTGPEVELVVPHPFFAFLVQFAFLSRSSVSAVPTWTSNPANKRQQRSGPGSNFL